jgi:two-component system response regulator FixJ
MLHERRVHIVDDEAEVRDSLTLLLSTAQIESRSYGSAEDYMTSNPLKEPACILLDNQLPGMSGIELLKRIVAATTDSTIIMITAYGDVPTAVLAMKAGAFHFVQKPFDAEALLVTVEEALSGNDEAGDVRLEIKGFKARQALLTQREREVLALLLEGLPTKLIAHQLRISSRTAEHHRAAVIQKMQARNISHLMRMAFIAKNLKSAERTAQ